MAVEMETEGPEGAVDTPPTREIEVEELEDVTLAKTQKTNHTTNCAKIKQ